MDKKASYAWDKFIEVTKNRKPVGFLLEVAEKLKSPKGLALDLGCGAGVDAKYLAENGFQVEAVDLDKNCLIQTEKICKGLPVAVIQKNIIDYEIKTNAYQIIISWNTLPFLKKEEAIKVLSGIQEGLIQGGFFVFGLFGPEDGWAKNHPEMSFGTVEELERLLSKMEFIKLLEERQRKPAATGEIKFWHQIQGIAKKK